MSDGACTCGVVHDSWAWNRRIIERIRALLPNPPATDEELVAVLEVALKGQAK
jgi:hypothetical protein